MIMHFLATIMSYSTVHTTQKDTEHYDANVSTTVKRSVLLIHAVFPGHFPSTFNWLNWLNVLFGQLLVPIQTDSVAHNFSEWQINVETDVKGRTYQGVWNSISCFELLRKVSSNGQVFI